MKIEKENKSIPNYSELLKCFCEINRKSIEIISNWRSKDRLALDKINANGIHDIVTDVDIAIEELTIQTIHSLSPKIRVFGEENFKQDFSATNESFFVVVDPIDGTKEFIGGTSNWSISICAVKNGNPVVASVFMPDRNELFTSVIGCGVFLNNRRLSSVSEKNNLIGVSPRQIKESIFMSKVKMSKYIPTNISALTPKICSMLRGDTSAAVYFEQEGVSAALWDYAAVHLLIHEFGGRMTSLTGDELPFSGSDVIHRKGWIAVANKFDHNQILTCLQA